MSYLYRTNNTRPAVELKMFVLSLGQKDRSWKRFILWRVWMCSVTFMKTWPVVDWISNIKLSYIDFFPSVGSNLQENPFFTSTFSFLPLLVYFLFCAYKKSAARVKAWIELSQRTENCAADRGVWLLCSVLDPSECAVVCACDPVTLTKVAAAEMPKTLILNLNEDLNSFHSFTGEKHLFFSLKNNQGFVEVRKLIFTFSPPLFLLLLLFNQVSSLKRNPFPAPPLFIFSFHFKQLNLCTG